MKKQIIVANWKANKTIEEIQEWFARVEKIPEKEIIICPPFHHIAFVKSLITQGNLSFKLGAQDVSSFATGAYTGEEPAALLSEFVEYVIIGHSERRINLHESEEILLKKVAMALEHKLTPIYCIQDERTPIPDGVTIIAYEPIFAIGSGTPDTPENADQIAVSVKKNTNIEYVIYGGSVTAENIGHFTKMEHIDGVILGKASLSTDTFIPLIKAS